MYTLNVVGPGPQDVRLVSPEVLTPADFRAIAAKLGQAPQRMRKSGFISARLANRAQTIETRWNGRETVAAAEADDWIAANMDGAKNLLIDTEGNANIYVIKAARFPELYRRDTGRSEYGAIYKSISVVEAVYLAGGFDIMMPWGKTLQANTGYLLLNGHEVYGNHKETFETTYEPVPQQ